MNKEQFEARIKELLPQTTEQALNAWTKYIQSLEEDEIDPASYLFDCSYVELSLIKQHQGEEIAAQLFNYGEHFVFNYFELRGAASKLAEGWALDKICSYTVKNGCDATQEEDEESRAALHAFQQEHAETDDKPADLPKSDAPKQLRILVVEPTKDPYVKEIDGSLASMQAIVGGFIQAVEPFEDPNVLLLCNEEAKLLGLPENRFLRNRNGIPYDIIHGTFFLAQGNGESFCSLTDKQIQTYGNEIEAKETRRRANAAAEQKRAQIAADFADHVSDLINWMYRDLAHLEGEREDQAIRTMHLALYVISTALQTQKVDESMRYLLRAFWNEFQPTFDESVYQALCAKQIMFAEIGEISEKRLGSFWRNLLDNLPPERRVGKDDDLQELLDDTSRLYNYFSSDSTPKIDFAEEIEPYWASVRLPEEPEEAEEYGEDEEPEEESEPWTDYYEKTVPAGNGGGYYQFCKVQFQDGGSPYAYLTGGVPLAVGDFVVVPVGKQNAEKTGCVTDVFVCSAQDAPYPPEKAKFVLRKSEQTAFTFTEKKVPPVEPAKNEKAAAPMPPVPVEPPAVQPMPEKPASFEVEPVPEDPTFTLPPLPEQDGPKKAKRRIPWGSLAVGVAAVAFFVFALPPLKRTAEANRQMVIAQQAAEQEKREQEEQRAEQARLEEEAAAQRRREEKQARIEALQNADLPYPGMPYDEISSTKLGRASKVTHEMRSGQVCYTFVWQIRDGDYLYPVFVVTAENKEVLTAEQRNLEYWNDMALKGAIYHQPEYKPSTPSQNQTGGMNHGSNGLRDEYDNPEDLYEDNPDWFEDEDEAWDEWEDG